MSGFCFRKRWESDCPATKRVVDARRARQLSGSSSLSPPRIRSGTPASPPRSSTRSRLAVATSLCAVFFVAAAVAIWWRNHDILRDLYDASSIIVAVGKLEAGLRPYADFRSTMQSATYLLNWTVEAVFGAHYLGLVKGGLLLTLAGGALLALLWRPAFGPLGAVLLAGAVAVGGFSQHVFVFYNTLGLLCLAVVVTGLANDPRLWPPGRWDRWAVLAALVVGGANKINFQALTLGLAGLIVVLGWLARRCTVQDLLATVGLLAGAGVAAPVALELLWTGASLRTWAFNILELPSERVGFALAGFRADLLWKPPYDVHHHLIFKALNGAGLVLVVAATAVAWFQSVRPLRGGRKLAAGLVLGAGCAAVGCGGLLLTTTNVETLALTSLAFPVGAAALVAAAGPPAGSRPGRLALALVPAASLLWTAVGGYAAWQGSRVLFGDAPPQRETYLRWTHPGPTAAYLQGVRLEPGWRDSILATVKEVERIQLSDSDLSSVLFGPAFEWMERGHPGAIVREMPVWYHHGTSLSPADGPWLEAALRAKGVDRLVANPHWESWPGSFWQHLAREFHSIDLGRFARIYERRGAPRPLGFAVLGVELTPWSFREQTGSNIHWRATEAPADTALHDSPWGAIAGRVGGLAWTWPAGAYLAQGNFVAMLHGSPEDKVEVTLRIGQQEGGQPALLFEHRVVLDAARPEVRVPFHASAGGKAVTFSIEVPAPHAHQVLGGWRDVRIGHASNHDAGPPALLRALLAAPAPDEPAGSVTMRQRAADPASSEGWVAAPFEAWQPVSPDRREAAVAVEVQRRPDGAGHPTLLTLAWYKAGRIEFLRQEIANPTETTRIELAAGLPEAGGWVGLLARAADPSAEPNVRARPPEWR